MSKGIHFMALGMAKQQLAKDDIEYDKANEALQEALKLGDLSENAEADAARDAFRRILNEREALQPALQMPVLRCEDATSTIQEGSIIHLRIFKITESPVAKGEEGYEEMLKSPPDFDAVLMYGGSLHIHRLIDDYILSVSTPIGRFLEYKMPGYYSVMVPGGYANIEVEKLSIKTTTEKDLYLEVV